MLIIFGGLPGTGKTTTAEILEQLREIAVDYLSRMNGATEDSGLPDACYRAIGSLGWPMDESTCQKVLLELQSDGE